MVAPDSHDWLAYRARRTPERIGLSFDDRRWTFAALHSSASAVADALRDHGVSTGDRVAVLAGNRPPTVVALHAVPRLGAAIVPLNLRLSDDELAYQLRLTAPSLLLTDAANRETAHRVADRVEVPVWELPGTLDALSNRAGAAEPALVPAEQVHTIMFTSGTTGRPKGAMLTASNHYHSALASMERLGLRDDDRWLCCAPLFHMAGLSIVIRGAVHGIPVILQDGFDPAAANAAIDGGSGEPPATIASLVPVMLQRMLDARADRRYPPSFRCALTGGGPMPAPLLRRCLAAGVPLTPTYGLTETASQVVTARPTQATGEEGVAGLPLAGVEVRIVEDGVVLDPARPGEVQVRGPSVMAGYYLDPEATSAALCDGWLRTGDIGSLDESGRLHIFDRRTDLIISGGENVYPAEIEAVLEEHPAVAEAGVVGVPDDRWGQRPCAWIVPRDGEAPSQEELLRHCRTRLASFKTPAAVRIVDALPRTAAGKLQRRRLRALIDAVTEGTS